MSRPRTPVGSYGQINTTRLPDSPGSPWEARTRVRDPDGVLRAVRATGPTKAKATNALKRKCADRAASGSINTLTRDSSVERLAEVWLEQIQQSDRAASTKLIYADMVDRFVRPALGQLRLREVTPAVVHRWLSSTKTSYKQRRSVLSAMFGLAVLHEAVEHNPVKSSPPVRGIRQPATPARAAQGGEIEQLHQAIRRWEEAQPNRVVPLRDLVLFQVSTGTRIGEVLAVRWCDLQLDEESGTGVVSINASVTYARGTGLVRSSTKTPGSVREAPLPGVTVRMLAGRFSASGLNDHESEHPVFPSRNGTHQWPHNMRRALRQATALADADLSWLTPHSLRDTALTAVSRKGTLLAASALGGHQTTAIPEQHYVDRRVEEDVVVPILDELLADWPA